MSTKKRTFFFAASLNKGSEIFRTKNRYDFFYLNGWHVLIADHAVLVLFVYGPHHRVVGAAVHLNETVHESSKTSR